MLRLVRESIAGFLKCGVDSTPNPEYAFELVLKKQYDLLIFDFLMPVLDGATLYLLISKVYANIPLEGRTLPPLILMSGHASQKKVLELLREPGVRGLLAKPFTIERLLEKVSQLIVDQ